MTIDGNQELVQEVNVLKEKVKLLLEKIKDLKGEFDVDSVTSGRSNNKFSPAHMTRPEVDSTNRGTAKETVHLSIKPFCDCQ